MKRSHCRHKANNAPTITCRVAFATTVIIISHITNRLLHLLFVLSLDTYIAATTTTEHEIMTIRAGKQQQQQQHSSPVIIQQEMTPLTTTLVRRTSSVVESDAESVEMRSSVALATATSLRDNNTAGGRSPPKCKHNCTYFWWSLQLAAGLVVVLCGILQNGDKR